MSFFSATSDSEQRVSYPPFAKFRSGCPANGDFFARGEAVKFNISARDAEDGDSTKKADEFGVRTLVSASWKGADAKVSQAEPGLALMKQSDCFNCHAIEQQIVGPPLLKIASINLAMVSGLTVRASSGNVGGKVEFHSGSPAGELLGSVDVPNTGGWEKWIEQKAALAPTHATTRTDVYAVFVNPGKSGLMNLDWVQFDGK